MLATQEARSGWGLGLCFAKAESGLWGRVDGVAAQCAGAPFPAATARLGLTVVAGVGRGGRAECGRNALEKISVCYMNFTSIGK